MNVPRSPGAGKLPFDGLSNLSEFAAATYLAALESPARENEAKHVRSGLRHFERYLKRVPRVDDLTSLTLTAFSYSLMEHGRARGTCDRYRAVLLRVGREAHAAGILPAAPKAPRLRARWNEPASRALTRPELNRAFGAARTMPGEISGLPASAFWPALLLLILDTKIKAAPLLSVPFAAFDLDAAKMKCGLFVYSLHSRTVEALRELGMTPRALLLPWNLDGAKPPFCQLYYHFRDLLWRARVKGAPRQLFEQIRQTGISDPDAIDAVKLSGPFRPRESHKRHPRLRIGAKRSRPDSRMAAPTGFAKKPKRRKRRRIVVAPFGFTANPKYGRLWSKHRLKSQICYLIQPLPALADRTLSAFYETVYVPRRLADRSKNTIICYRSTINLFNQFCASVVLLDQLTDDLVERFLCWMRDIGYAKDSRKRARGELLAIWRYAWRKRKVESLPRDVEEIRCDKTQPEAWSVQEVSRLLEVAAVVEGTVCGIPARLYWPSVILTIYDTGLRIAALMNLRVADVDFENGWVKAKARTQKQKADQSLPICAVTANLLSATAPEKRELLFPWPFASKQPFNERLRLLLQRAGLPSTRKDLAHRLRRTNATYICDASDEFAAMRQLGHSSISVTRRYIDTRKLSAPRIVDSMQRPHFATAPVEPLRIAHDETVQP